NGDRLTLRSELIAVESGQTPLAANDVIVVSGGARGVTAATTIKLAESSGATFVLLGRSEVQDEPASCVDAIDDAAIKRTLLEAATLAGDDLTPRQLSAQVDRVLNSREIRSTLETIASVGGRGIYRTVDITDRAAVAVVLTEVRGTIGPITGVVHGAGVLADKVIAEKTNEQFDAVFSTKVTGLKTLLDLTITDSLKLLCLFSSVAARTGNLGQSDYAMANEVLNKVAIAEQTRRGPGCVVKALGWGPWAGGMVTPELKRHFESMGVTLIPLGAGATMFVDEIASAQTDQVEVVLGGGVLVSGSANGSNSTLSQRADDSRIGAEVGA
ncbi:MAG: SDR family NAD(P)-dependent oxidoreductase, partial [Actinobacteria bacterium]|nr:SDR family NAD(P)-dependent oxidoreductase [Actinomycetota bacterium]